MIWEKIGNMSRLMKGCICAGLVASCQTQQGAAQGEVRTSPSEVPAPCNVSTLPDSSVSPDGRNVLRMTTEDHGRRNMVVVDRRSGKVLFSEDHDISNFLWLPDGTGLVFAASPVADRPGLYLWRSEAKRSRVLIAARNLSDSAYPDGADWFLLCGVEALDAKALIRYLHFPHVDSVDFERFPTLAIQDTATIPLAPHR